jgi:hypothetical protein
MEEAKQAKQGSTTHLGPPRYEVIHRVNCALNAHNLMYIEQPWVVNTGSFTHLRGGQQVSNMELYLERNTDVIFLVLRDYRCCGPPTPHPADRSRLVKEVEMKPESMLVEECIEIVSDDLRSALANLSTDALRGIPHPKFVHDDDDEDDSNNDNWDRYKTTSHSSRNSTAVSYPYLWFYHRRFKLSKAIDRLEEIKQESLSVFCGYIHDRMSDEWTAVDKLISKREITAEYIRYIYVSPLANPLVLVSYRQRFQGKLSSGRPKAARKPKYRLQ